MWDAKESSGSVTAAIPPCAWNELHCSTADLAAMTTETVSGSDRAQASPALPPPMMRTSHSIKVDSHV